MFRRILLAGALASALFAVSLGTASAGTTGQISGTVGDLQTHTPLAGVLVSATSPTGNYNATTNAKGFYVMTGVIPDTFFLTFKKAGYDLGTAVGVTVVPDQTAGANIELAKAVKEIGRLLVRGAASAFQPTQSVDTYTITTKQVDTGLGKKNNLSETQLIRSLPGATQTAAGATSLRGGLRTEIAFQYEGIDYTDAETSQFINSLRLNGIDQLQLTPGAGDSKQGNGGTGVVNIITKRGTYPPSGLTELSAATFPYNHFLVAQYGFATPNGRFSDFASFTASRESREGSFRGADATKQGFFYSTDVVNGNDFIDNLTMRFGRNNNQQVQLFYQTEAIHFDTNKGGWQTLCNRTCDPFALASLSAQSGLSTASVASILSFYGDQVAQNQPLGRPSNQIQPNETIKLQYSNNLDASTYVSARVYRVNSVVNFMLQETAAGTGGTAQLQGGFRTGSSADLTKQLNDKNLAEAGLKYEFSHGILDGQRTSLGFQGLLPLFGGSNEVRDFVPPGTILASGLVCPNCGYLFTNPIAAAKLPNGPGRVPLLNFDIPVDAQYLAFYLQDTYSPTDRLKLQLGARMDGMNVLAAFPINDNSQKRPRIFEPHAAFTYRVTPVDSIRFSYARTVEFSPLSNFSSAIQKRASFVNFVGIPATQAVCGPDGVALCTDYADQLYWEYQDNILGPIATPVKPETFNNYDLSYGHEFRNNWAVKVTPFYRRGYNVIVSAADIIGTNPATGNPILGPSLPSNLGINKTTGVEFYLTKEAAFGWSGYLSATYINEFSNVPPLFNTLEDFFPTTPRNSLALGNVYRVGFLSPFQAVLSAQYKTRSGWRANPIVRYDRGFPIGVGRLTAFYVNGKPYNVPNTNLTSPTGSGGAGFYVDPQNPGSFFNPIIAADRGTPEQNAAGGAISNPRMVSDFVLEFSPPKGSATYGMYLYNVFNEVAARPSLNVAYQPVAPGIAGPLTGFSANAAAFPGLGLTSVGDDRHGLSPYLLNQTFSPPALPVRTFIFYYQQKL